MEAVAEVPLTRQPTDEERAALIAAAPTPQRQRSRIEPKGEEELRLLYEAFRSEEQRLTAKIEDLA